MDYEEFQRCLGKALLALRKRNYCKLSDPHILKVLAPLIESFSEPRTEVAADLLGVLEKAIAQLPHQERRKVATWYYQYGWSPLNISLEVSLSIRTTYRYLRRAREELAFLLWQRIHRSITDTNRGGARETALADPIKPLDLLLREEFGLSERETEIAQLLAEPPTEWFRNYELAKELYISENTLKTHLRHIFRKLRVHSKAEVAAKIAELKNSNVKRHCEDATGKGYRGVASGTAKDSRGLSSDPIVHRHLGSG